MKAKLPSYLRVSLGLILVSLSPAHASGLFSSSQTKDRIQEKNEAFNALTLQQQSNILGGVIERGNSSDMVYMALGKPRKIVTSADGHKAMWVYVEYYSLNSPAATVLNNPDARYLGGQVLASSSRDTRDGGPITFMRPCGLPCWHTAPSETIGSGPTQSLSLPDLVSNTVYVFFFHGKVAEIKLDGDATLQSAAQQPKPTKRGLNAPTARRV